MEKKTIKVLHQKHRFTKVKNMVGTMEKTMVLWKNYGTIVN